MFTVYIDDSGTSPSQHVAIATALIVPARQIVSLDKEWETLKRNERFTDFHVSEFVAKNPKTIFAQWDDPRRDRVFRRIREITKKYGTTALSFAVNKEDYESYVPQELREFTGNHHYTWAVRHVVNFLDQWRFSRPNPPPAFEYVFDWMGKRTDERRVEVETVMEQMESWANDKEKRVGDYTHYGFRYRKELPALQCADVLAWTCYQYALFAFRKTPLQEYAEVAWNDFANHLGRNTWLKAVSVKSEHLKKWIDAETQDGRSLKNFLEWRRKSDEKNI